MPLDENAPLGSDAAHLRRRTGFGAVPAQLEDLQGLTRGQAADQLLAFKPSGFKPNGKTIEGVHDKVTPANGARRLDSGDPNEYWTSANVDMGFLP